MVVKGNLFRDIHLLQDTEDYNEETGAFERKPTVLSLVTINQPYKRIGQKTIVIY